jgi:rhomboid protease GluP
VRVRCAQPAAAIRENANASASRRGNAARSRRAARFEPVLNSAGRLKNVTRQPDSLVCTQVRYYRNAFTFSQGTPLALSPRLRWKLDRIREQLGGIFGGRREPPRPKLCPACGTLVGSSATRCHQCGASLTFSLAAASRSLGRLMPATSPATYAILTLSCVLYGLSLLWTIRESGFMAPGGGLFGLFSLGGINGDVLQRLGASLPLPYDLIQPWRLVMAVFLHGSLMHIVFNMWVLMDVGPAIEELYGSARYFFIYVVTGIGGYVLSSGIGRHPSIGGSGALLGLIGVLLAVTMGRRSIGMQMLRSQIIKWLIYIVIWGLVFPGIDNFAHLGGFATGFGLGKIMMDRQPATADERKRAYALGWAAALVVVASFFMMILTNVRTT